MTVTLRSRGFRCLFYAVFLGFWVLIVYNIIGRPDYNTISLIKQRKPAEHFFFELLPAFDPKPAPFNYKMSSRTLKSTAFSGIMDRTLFVQYLTKRFAYSSFMQLGCKFEKIHLLLPESMNFRACTNQKYTTQNLSAFLQANMPKYGIVMIEPEFLKDMSDAVEVSELAIASLEDGGMLILVHTNPSSMTMNKSHKLHNLWEVALHLRNNRPDLDVVTLDVDGGLTLVRTKSGLSVTTPATATPPGQVNVEDSTSPNSPPLPGATDVPLAWSDQAAIENKESLLKLMSFEEIHDWLAPTGNVDGLTAFGGEKAVQLWWESRKQRLRCSTMLAANLMWSSGGGGSNGSGALVSEENKALSCFNGITIDKI